MLLAEKDTKRMQRNDEAARQTGGSGCSLRGGREGRKAYLAGEAASFGKNNTMHTTYFISFSSKFFGITFPV